MKICILCKLANYFLSSIRNNNEMSTFLVAANVFTLWYMSLRHVFRKSKKMRIRQGKKQKKMVSTSCGNVGTRCSGRYQREVVEASSLGQPAYLAIAWLKSFMKKLSETLLKLYWNFSVKLYCESLPLSWSSLRPSWPLSRLPQTPLSSSSSCSHSH